VSFLCGSKWISKDIYVDFAVRNGNEEHKPLYLWEEIQLYFSAGKYQLEDDICKRPCLFVASRKSVSCVCQELASFPHILNCTH
jgi:hypothetical protein